MKTEKNITQLLKEASERLLDSKYLIEIERELIYGDNVSEGAIMTLSEIILNNTISSFKDIEKCRSLITIEDWFFGLVYNFIQKIIQQLYPEFVYF